MPLDEEYDEGLKSNFADMANIAGRPGGAITAAMFLKRFTGKLRWAWDMDQPERSGLPPREQTYTRGTPNMWTIASGDNELGLVYLPMGNSAGDYWSGSRTENQNKYATSLVAIDVNTGKPVWHFQAVRKDVWDYDLGSQASLIDYPTAAGKVPAILLPTKQGDMYILDRRNGQPRANRPSHRQAVHQFLRAGLHLGIQLQK